jgi:hypothetical protein
MSKAMFEKGLCPWGVFTRPVSVAEEAARHEGFDFLPFDQAVGDLRLMPLTVSATFLLRDRPGPGGNIYDE